jgi:hypothetical protein
MHGLMHGLFGLGTGGTFGLLVGSAPHQRPAHRAWVQGGLQPGRNGSSVI